MKVHEDMRQDAFRFPAAAATVVLTLAGCHGIQPLPFGFEKGGTLPPEDYARLEPLARAQPSNQTAVGDRPIKAYPLVTYVYSFRPGFNSTQISHMDIGTFAGASGDAGKIAGELPSELLRQLTKSNLPAAVLQSNAPPGNYVLSGIVTRVGSPELDVHTDDVAAQVEAKITYDSTIVGTMQVNVVVTTGNIVAPLIGLIVASIEGGRAKAVARNIADILRRARGGENQGTSNDTMHGYLMTPTSD